MIPHCVGDNFSMGFAEGAWKVLGFEERCLRRACQPVVTQAFASQIMPRHSPSQRHRVAEFKGHALTIRAILVDFGKVHSIHFTLAVAIVVAEGPKIQFKRKEQK